jgi:beta-glucosidase
VTSAATPTDPPGIELGALVTATEADGAAPAADWWRWEHRRRAPSSGRGFGLAAAPGDWFRALAALGATSIVLTLEWARLEPVEGRLDPEAVEALQGQLALARDHGLAPWGCLVDGTLPGWFADDHGGLLDDRGRSLVWPRHVDRVGELFGDLVAGWVTQREPVRQALRAWAWGQAPPGQRDPRRASEAVRAAVLADGEAWRLLRGAGNPVATVHTACSVHAGDDGPEARAQARHLDGLLWGSWTGALVDGEVRVPGLPPVAAPHLRGGFDVLGLQLRAAVAVDGTGALAPHPPGRQPGPSGGVSWPEGVATALRRAGEEVPDRTLAVVADVADAPADGRHQADHLEALIDEVLAARADGLAITRWWQSSPVDGYGWERGPVPGGVLDPEGHPKPAAAALARLGGGPADGDQTRDR